MGRHYSRYLSTLPLEKGLPDHKMGLISETLVGYQVHGHLWERGNEQSHMILLLYSCCALFATTTDAKQVSLPCLMSLAGAVSSSEEQTKD